MGMGLEWTFETLLEVLDDYDTDHSTLGIWHPAPWPMAAKMERSSAVQQFALDIVWEMMATRDFIGIMQKPVLDADKR